MKSLTILVALALVVMRAETTLGLEVVTVKDNTVLETTLGNGKRAKIEIKTTAIPASYVFGNLFQWGGDSGFPPARIVADIAVYQKGARVSLPLSAFADLSTLRYASLEPKGSNGFVLMIMGGDASVAYMATFQFRNEEIYQRRVVHGEFPDLYWEETTYRFPRPGEIE